MKDLIELFEFLISKLPSTVKTKINKTSLDRGYKGVFTARRKRSDKVLIPFESFKNNWKFNTEIIKKTYLNGYRVLCSPSEYFTNIEILNNIPTLVRYQSYCELKKYPTHIDWNSVKKDRKSYLDDEIIWVQDIKNLDKYAKKGKSTYLGPKHVGQHEMDYACDDEILKVKMCLLYQVIKCHDFQSEMANNEYIEKYLEYSEKFEQNPIYLENPKLQEYTTKYGYTVCPELINFPNKKWAKISFSDIVDGRIDGDIGREDFNRTATKINIHHKERLISGKLNHNHKNVFFGTACGNNFDASLRLNDIPSLNDLFE